MPSIPIYNREPVISVSKDNEILSKPKIDLSQLFSETEFVSLYPSTAYGFNEYFSSVAKAGGFTPKITKYVQRLSEARAHVMVNGFARFAFSDSVFSEGEVQIAIPAARPSKALAAWNKDSTNPLLKELIEFLGSQEF